MDVSHLYGIHKEIRLFPIRHRLLTSAWCVCIKSVCMKWALMMYPFKGINIDTHHMLRQKSPIKEAIFGKRDL